MTGREDGRLVLAADLGGTRSRVVLADREGRVVAEAASGAGNPYRAGPAVATANLRQAIEEVLSGRPAAEVAAACVGMAGVSHPSARGMMQAAMLDLVHPPLRILRDDGAIAFRAAFPPEGGGILVMAGTGSGALAKGEGPLVRVGGLGPDLGDEGSAHAMALAALRAVARIADGRAVPSLLSAALLEAAGAAGPGKLPGLMARRMIDVAALFPVVARAARDGDDTARGVIEDGARDLARLAREAAALAGVGGGAVVATAGSVLGTTLRCRDALGRALQGGAPSFTLGPHVEEPVQGAVLLALDALAAGTAAPGW